MILALACKVFCHLYLPILRAQQVFIRFIMFTAHMLDKSNMLMELCNKYGWTSDFRAVEGLTFSLPIVRLQRWLTQCYLKYALDHHCSLLNSLNLQIVPHSTYLCLQKHENNKSSQLELCEVVWLIVMIYCCDADTVTAGIKIQCRDTQWYQLIPAPPTTDYEIIQSMRNRGYATVLNK